MTDSSNTPHIHAAGSTKTPAPAGLLHAEYVCPHCDTVVLTIEGNELKYLKSHVRPEIDPNSNEVSLLLYHPLDGGNIIPGKVLEKPFLVLKSSVMTPLSNK